MSIIVFLIILSVLVLAHEFGHFLAAKRAGLRVDEFGLGFPPRLFSWRRGETLYSVNLLLFGGFVKIFGENPDLVAGLLSERSLAIKPKSVQAIVLAAGIFFNLLLAWLLFSISFTLGALAPAGEYWHGRNPENPALTIVSIMAGSPAERAGLQTGDILTALAAPEKMPVSAPEEVSNFITAAGNREIKIFYSRDGRAAETSAVPVAGLGLDHPAIGISMDLIGVLRLPPHLAILEGARSTGLMTWEVARSIGLLIGGIFTGTSSLQMLTGPVGIVGAVGQALNLSFSYLLFFTAFISINLAILNLLPLPALDGGRLLFLLIEKIKGSRIPPKIAGVLNFTGFALLIALMIAVTVNDVIRLL